MSVSGSRFSNRPPAFRTGLAVTLFLSGVVGATGAFADDDDVNFRPGNLLISRSVYDNNPANGVVDPTNPVPGSYFRVVAEVDAHGHFHFTKTNALQRQ